MDQPASVVMAPARGASPQARAGAALALSLAVHALLLGPWLGKPASEPRSPRRAGGTMTLRLTAAPAPQPAAHAMAQASPSRPPTRLPRRPPRKPPPSPSTPALAAAPPALASVAPPPASPADATPVAAAAPAPVPVPPAAADGSAFAGLFAPILSRPLGRGGWGRAAAHGQAPRDADASPPTLPPEQALAVLRASLLERLEPLGHAGAASEPALHCEIAVDTARHLAEVRCSEPADQARPWAALHGVLASGAVARREAQLCLRISPGQVAAVDCVEADLTAGR